MITSIRLVNFKNFADETLRVGPFTVIVGANASGKSNIRDAFRFLHGIGRCYTLAEIIGGKFGPGGQREWEPIRGAPNEIARLEQAASSVSNSTKVPFHRSYRTSEFAIHLEFKWEEGVRICYLIRVGSDPQSPEGFKVLEETLTKRPDTGTEVPHFPEKSCDLGLCLSKGTDSGVEIASQSIPSLTRVKESDVGEEMWHVADELHYTLSQMGFAELSPERMREPSFPGANILGPSGENLPTVMEGICASPGKRRVLAEWLGELTPMDVQDFVFPRDPSGRVHLMIREASGRTVSAYSASDGTLRFLALLAMLLEDSSQSLYFFEEIDTGIHPARQSLLLELIEKQAAEGGVQVVTTTHAPDLLTLVNDTTFEDMSIVCRLEDSDDAIIRRVAELPNVRELRKSGSGLGGLLMEGWMETALAFTENYEEAEGDGE